MSNVQEDAQVMNLKQQLAEIEGEVAYLIGGPHDLTKMYISRSVDELYLPDITRRRWSFQRELTDLTKYEVDKCVYRLLTKTSLGMLIYEYAGTIKAD